MSLLKNGILARVRRIFSWSSKSTDGPTTHTNQARNEPYYEFRTAKTPKKIINPFNFPEPIVKSVTNGAFASKESGNISSMETAADSPNVTLSKFFAEKGDQPLSSVEMEGVLSLISKSVGEKNVDNTQSTDNTVIGPPHRQLLSSSNSSFHSNASVHSYKPTYSPATTNTRQRVFDYSTLPNSYKNRIKSPLLDLASPQREAPKQSTQDKLIYHDRNNKKLSHTANALLSILDGEKAIPSKAEKSSIQEFANPYASSPSSTFLMSSRKRILKQKEQRQQQQQEEQKESNATFDSPTPAIIAKPQLNEITDTSSPITTQHKEGETKPSQGFKFALKDAGKPVKPIVEEHSVIELSDDDSSSQSEPEESAEGDLSGPDPGTDATVKSGQIPETEESSNDEDHSFQNDVISGAEFIFPTVPKPAYHVEVDELKVQEYSSRFEF